MKTLIITAFTAIVCLVSTPVFAAQNTLQSQWFTGISASQDIAYPVKNYKNNQRNNIAYHFLAGLAQIGYKTTFHNGAQTFQQFQQDFALKNTAGIITFEDILVLDKHLKKQEKKINQDVQKVFELYPNMRLDFDNCPREPQMFYLSLLADTEDIFDQKRRDELKNFEIRCANSGPRGFGGVNTIIIHASHLMNRAKFLNIFIHEMGHVLDDSIGYSGADFTAGIFSDEIADIDMRDPSIGFYQISWNTGKNKKLSSNRSHFVSGYAMTNPFEDLAETMVAYTQYGKNFRFEAQNNVFLQAKYDFIQHVFFEGKEFDTGWQGDIPHLWDITGA